MAGKYVDDTIVKDYMSSAIVRATYDDNNDGVIDPGVIAQEIRLAEARFDGVARAIYAYPLTSPIDPLVIDIVLRLIHCRAIKRAPEVARQQGVTVCEDVEALLKDLRDGKLVLDHALPAGGAGLEPAAMSECPRGYDRLEPRPGRRDDD